MSARLATDTNAASVPDSPDHPGSIFVDGEGVIRRWAAECTETFGYTEDEAVGQSLDLIIPEALRSLHWRGFDKATRRGRLKRSRAVLRVPAMHKDGSIIAVRFVDETLVHGKDGTVDGAVVTVAGRDLEWVARAYRLMLAALAIGERVWRSVRSRRAPTRH